MPQSVCKTCGKTFKHRARQRGGYCSPECYWDESPVRQFDRHDCTDYEECLWKSSGPCVCDGCMRFAKRPKWVDLVRCASPGSNANWMG
jgi:hypothetical protein